VASCNQPWSYIADQHSYKYNATPSGGNERTIIVYN